MLNEADKNTQGYAWCLATGIATCANAAFNCFIICNHPEYQKVNEASTTPAGADPSKMTEENVKRYLAAHPEVAAAALGGAKPNAGGGGGSSSSGGGGGGGGDGDWVKEAEARAATGGGAKKSGGSGGFFGFGGGGGAKKAPESTAYEPPVLPFSASAPAPAAAAPPLPGRAANNFAADNVEDNPFASS
jgi:hypothetical protein